MARIGKRATRRQIAAVGGAFAALAASIAARRAATATVRRTPAMRPPAGKRSPRRTRDSGGSTKPRRAAARRARRAPTAYAHSLGCGNRSSSCSSARRRRPSAARSMRRSRRMQRQSRRVAGARGRGGGGRSDRALQRRMRQSAARATNLLDALFGGATLAAQRRRQHGRSIRIRPDRGGAAATPARAKGSQAHAGSKAVCVRTCDGSFFPGLLFRRRGARCDSLEDMCRALCPNADVALYSPIRPRANDRAGGCRSTARRYVD